MNRYDPYTDKFLRDTQYDIPSFSCGQENDTISRQAAIDLLKQMRKDGDTIPWEGKDVFARIRKMPSAQPNIIRCKDCKYWMPYDWMFSEVWRSQNIDDYQEDEIGCNYCEMSMKADDFCSRAERRE